jgi:hypothetical protein
MAFMQLYCIPYLGSRSHQLVHPDDYLYQKVQFSTFTIKDDVLLMIDHKVYIFNQQGVPLLLEMSKEDELLLATEGMEIVRITSCSQYHMQTLLFINEGNYYLF